MCPIQSSSVYHLWQYFITNWFQNPKLDSSISAQPHSNFCLFLTSVYNYDKTPMDIDVVYLDFRKHFTVSHTTSSCPSYYNWEFLEMFWGTPIIKDSSVFLSTINALTFFLYCQEYPQGSILCPLLFLIYIHDLPLSASFSSLLLFADDTKCFRPIRCDNDTCLLQQDLNTLTNWSSDWKIKLKCILFRFCPSFHTTYPSNYTINPQQLVAADAHKNLGIVMSADLSWCKPYDLIYFISCI